MSDDIAISVNNLTKIYKLYDSPQDRLKEALHPLRRKFHHDFHALNDISFEIKKGESFGIIGKNGSGKSTLLKTITGVLTPTIGSVSVNGKISALLELGAGFNPDLTGMENIYFNGTLMGFTREEMDEMLDGILAFADIGEFVHQPVKTYSSGMFVRLAFAVAVIVKPDILVVDEALSVGDVFFQQKCFSKIREIIDSGTTCLFVSHDTKAIMNICSRVILLDNGVMDFFGAPEEAVSRYYGKMGKRAPRNKPLELQEAGKTSDGEQLMSSEEIYAHNILPVEGKRHGAGGVQILAARVTDSHGNDSMEVRMMESLTYHLLLKTHDGIANPSAGIHLFDRLGNLVFASGTRQLGQRLPDMLPDQELIVKMVLTFTVQPGEYTFSLGAAESASAGLDLGYLHDRHEMLGPLQIVTSLDEIVPFYGMAKLPFHTSFELRG
jgi:lipopolysaccharide transport system ATP-binding protein